MSCTIPMSEVRKHCKKRSIWMAINNDVYDVSKFLNEHPGGEDSLLEWAGKDATQAFEDVGHSSDARILMRKYKIGTLPAGEKQIYLGPCIISSKSNKSWRTYEGSPRRSRTKIPTPKESKNALPKRDSRPTNTIIVPIERYPKICMPEPDPPPTPPPSSSWWKWILLGLGAALVAGFVAKKKLEGA